MELLKVFAALLRRKWLFLQAVVFFTVGALVIGLLQPPRYDAVAKISIESSSASLSILGEMDLGEMAQSLSGDTDDVETKIALAEMRPVIDEVVRLLQLRDRSSTLLTAEKFLAPGILDVYFAQPSLLIEQEQGTNILLVTGSATHPELAAQLADTIVEVYLNRSKENAKSETRAAREFIERELKTVQINFDQALGDVADAQQAEAVIDLDAELKAAVSRLSELLAQSEGVKAEMQGVRAEISERRRLSDDESVSAVSPGTSSTNSLVRGLRESLSDLQLKLKLELIDKKDSHPDVVALVKQIRNLQDELSIALEEQHTLDPAVQASQIKLAGLRQRGDEIDSTIAATIQEFGAYPQKARRIYQLQLAAEATQTIYQSLLEQQYQIEVAEAMTVSDMRVAEPALPPTDTAAPKVILYVLLGFLVGAGIGIGLVFLVEYIDDSVKNQDDLRGVWPLPVLGMIPRFKLKTGGVIIGDLPVTDPIFEAYRNIRNGLAFAGVDSPINVLAVTSCAPGEGKSTFTTNLGICLAQDGQRVVIIDCDLRRPTQHRAFNTINNAAGVSSIISQAAAHTDVLQQTPIANLSVITSGPLPSNPGRIVESLRMRQLVADLARSYDMVLIDAPPVLAVADALSLARTAKGMVVVVEAGKTTRRMLTDVRSRFESAGLEPVGAVFNKVDIRNTTGYYGHYTQQYTPSAKASGGGA